MEFSFTEEQAQFRDIVARFCRDKASTTTVRKMIEAGAPFDRDLWHQMCNELGLAAIHIPEQRGGAGFSAIELGIVMEELGRSLLPSPYLSSVLASTALAGLEDAEAGERLLASIAAAAKIVTLVLDPGHGDPINNDLTLTAGKLSGTARATLDAQDADQVLAITRDKDGEPTLCLVERGATGLKSRSLRTMDGTRPQAGLEFDGVEVERLGVLTGTQIKHIYDTALVALANEMVGGAQALLDSTVAYTRIRVQFGRPIGSFQAIKHRLADLLVDVELAKVAAYQAAAALAAGEDVSATASLAKFTAGDAYMNAAREAIQLHGGIGFTWENDTHLWYRRAKSSEVFLGTPAFHRERMIEEMTA